MMKKYIAKAIVITFSGSILLIIVAGIIVMFREQPLGMGLFVGVIVISLILSWAFYNCE